jgi:hypothetical protein
MQHCQCCVVRTGGLAINSAWGASHADCVQVSTQGLAGNVLFEAKGFCRLSLGVLSHLGVSNTCGSHEYPPHCQADAVTLLVAASKLNSSCRYEQLPTPRLSARQHDSLSVLLLAFTAGGCRAECAVCVW